MLINILHVYIYRDKTNHPMSSNNHPSVNTNKARHYLKSGGGLQNQREHHISLRKDETMHPTVFSENYSSSGMQIILIKVKAVCILLANLHILYLKRQYNVISTRLTRKEVRTRRLFYNGAFKEN